MPTPVKERTKPTSTTKTLAVIALVLGIAVAGALLSLVFPPPEVASDASFVPN
jgi:hypothetical protein